ncbi:MAG: hypothetical protein IJS50_02255, partial [Desulfovibrio sp.]|nr:hypothetical protein [Desulfovibrio sp.]
MQLESERQRKTGKGLGLSFYCLFLLSLALVLPSPLALADTLDNNDKHYSVVTANAIPSRTFTFYFYDEGYSSGSSGMKPSSRTLMLSEQRDVVNAANLWAEILKPGSSYSPLSSYNAYISVGGENLDNNAHCGGGTLTGDPSESALPLAIKYGRAPKNMGEFGEMSIGTLHNAELGLDLTQLSADNSYVGTVFHEIGHALGLSSSSFGLSEGSPAPDNFVIKMINLFDSHLRDAKGAAPEVGTTFTKVADNMNEPGTFYVGPDHNSGVVFVGNEVAKVMSDGAAGDNPSDAVFLRYGLPINGVENGTILDLSHSELDRSMMSHQDYRNYSSFMEAELAMLQDLGYQIDRNLFYGQSLYVSGTEASPLAATINTAHTDVSGTLGVGLHVYGSYRDIAVNAPLKVTGQSGTGIRLDGTGSKLTINSSVIAEGTDAHSHSAGLLVAYGKNHEVTIGKDAYVSGRGTNSIGARFDFGHNLCGDDDEYRGSYIYTKLDDTTGELKLLSLNGEENDGLDRFGVPINLDGPLVTNFNVEGRVYGKKAAIFISDNALVKNITIAKKGMVLGDIVSEWNPSNERIQFSGKRSELMTTLTLNGTLMGSIYGKDSIRFINNVGTTIPNVTVAQLVDNAGLTIARKGELLVSGSTVVAAQKTLTISSNARATFTRGLHLRSGATLSLASGSEAKIGDQGSLTFGQNSRITMNDASFEANASSVLSFEGQTAKAQENADTLFA